MSNPRHHTLLNTVSGTGPLVLILLLSLAIRLWGIGTQSLWHDEVLTTISATVPLAKVVHSVEHNENKPPLYFFLMNLWVRVAGLSETALRLPSAVFGVAGVAVIYLLGRDLFDARTGLVAALLLAFSRYHIAYSQEARTYSLTFLLVLFAVWFALRITRRNSMLDQIGYVACAAGAMYAHPFAAFALAAINVYYVASYAMASPPVTDLRRWIILQCAFSLAFWPWLSRTWLVVKTGLPWIVQSTPIPLAMLSYSGSIGLLVLLHVLAAVAIAYALVRRQRGVLLLLLLILFALFGPLAFESRHRQTFVPRYGIVVVGAMLLLTAYGAARLRPWATILICAAYIAMSMNHFRPGYANYYGAEPKADVRAAVRHVIAHAKPGDVTANPSSPLLSRPIQHYLRRANVPLMSALPSPDLRHWPRIWLFHERWDRSDADPPPPSGYDIASRTAFEGVVLYELVASSNNPAT